MIRAFVIAVIATVLTACGTPDVDADTRDLLRRDMTAVATAVAAQDYVAANDALRQLLGDTEAAYLAGKISSSQRSSIVDAAANLQDDINAALAPPPVVVAPEPDFSGDSGDSDNSGPGKGKDKDKGNNGNGNGKGKN